MTGARIGKKEHWGFEPAETRNGWLVSGAALSKNQADGFHLIGSARSKLER